MISTPPWPRSIPTTPGSASPPWASRWSGFQAVRDYYLARFSTWPGPVMEHFDRVSVTDHAIFVEGRLKPQPGRQINALAGPCVVVIDLREGLVMGETVYGAPSRA
jgi:hypothetical protein